MAGLVLAAILGGAMALYGRIGAPGYGDLALADRIAMAEELRRTRPDQEEAEARRPAPDEQAQDPQFAELMTRLRTALKDRPDDLRGYRLLAENEAARGDFVAARKAQARVIEIRGDAADAADYTDLADMMIQATGGYVSPQAEQALGQALKRDPENGIARYYSGVMMGQIGRPDLGFRIWRQLLNDSAPDDPWTGPLRARIESMADRAGVRYSLPEQTDLRGPDQADIDAAAEMSDADRQEMIRGMVEGLAARLGSEGGTPEEWARLIGALGVLGETERAREIWDEAKQVFAGDETALARLASQAEQAGLTE
ncbi:c-type cytochrome biogenesis protein CcmI [Aquicoccus sp. SCR17]|nr:c-type cytochrome biogenesis protein CcmI [Carideicomes alvinocaridis]